MIFRGRYFDRCCGGWHCDGLAGTFVPAAETGICHDAFLGLLPFYLFCVLAKIRDVMDYIQSLADLIHVDALYMGVILKMIGITYISEFASAICKDAGYASIAGQIQVLAKLSILALGMPVLMAFLSTVEAFL